MPEPMDTLEVFEHRSDIIEEFQNSVDANNVSVLVYLVWGKVSRCDEYAQNKYHANTSLTLCLLIV